MSYLQSVSNPKGPKLKPQPHGEDESPAKDLAKSKRVSARKHKPTDKNKNFLSSQSLQGFKQGLISWKRRVSIIREFLGSELDPSSAQKHIQQMEADYKVVSEHYQMLCFLEREDLDGSIHSKFKSIELEASDILNLFTEAYPELRVPKSSMSNKDVVSPSPTHVVPSPGDVVSPNPTRVVSPSSAHVTSTNPVQPKVQPNVNAALRSSVKGDKASVRSGKSKFSDAVAAVSKAEVKLKQIDLDKSLIELEQRKVQLEIDKLKANDVLQRAASELEALSERSSLSDVSKDNDSIHSQSLSALDHTVDKDKQVQSYVNSLPEDPGSGNLVKVLCDQLTLARLPLPEPGVFTGDPLHFSSWERAFDILISNKSIPERERLHYLSKYLGGDAKACVEGYFLLGTSNAYDEARKLLSTRYGSSFTLGKAFRDKLAQWPKVYSNDIVGLRKFADYLHQCRAGMAFIPSLKYLDCEEENEKLLQKLPTGVVKSWGRKVYRWNKESGGFPPFTEFVDFLQEESDIANHPVTSSTTIRKDTFVKPHHKQEARRSFNHAVDTQVSKEARRSFNHAVDTQVVKTCRFCNKPHHLAECSEFSKKPYSDKKAYVFKERLCYCCLNGGHIGKKCKKRATCKTCSGKHPTSLHADDYKPVRRDTVSNSSSLSPQANSFRPATTSSNQSSSHSGATCMSSVSDSGLSAMIVPVYVSSVDSPTHEKLVYALLDTQSDRSFLLESTCRSLGLSGTDVQFSLSTMTSENMLIKCEKVSGLMIRAFDSDVKFSLPSVYTRNVMPTNRSHIPTPSMALKWPHLVKVSDKLMPITDAEVGLLIGYDCPRALAPREVIVPEGDGPYAQRTDLGWGIVGVIDYNACSDDTIGFSHRVLTYGATDSDKVVQVSVRSQTKECILSPQDVLKVLETDFKCDDHGVGLSQDDKKFLRVVGDGICKTSDGYYQMPLPFKHDNVQLPNNFMLAEKRLEHLKSKLSKDSKFKSEYVSFMSDMISNGYAEKVGDSELTTDQAWYIPHHGVYHQQKNKIRVVFDCSARFKGKSINDLLLQGPDLTNTLVGVLSRFREEDVAFCCDVAKMFYQFKVSPEYKDYLRFLWWDQGDTSSVPSVYRMTVHLFGAASSPSCANFGLRQIASDYESQFGLDVGDFLRNNFYVDDGLKSVPDEDSAVSLIHRTVDLCKQGGLKLHKFISNSRKVLESIPKDYRADDVQQVNLKLESLPVERTLGVEWCVDSDTFQFRVTLKDRPYTRRGLLSTVASIYDPLGFISPFSLIGKRLLQTLCIEGKDWDEPISDELRPKWEQWLLAIIDLSKVKLDRCIKPKGFKVAKAEFHHFSDASVLGYGQCSYLRLVSASGEVHVALLSAKSRVSPIKPVTIPRLELSAAVVAVKASLTLASDLTYKDSNHFFWTDSRVVLGYITNEARRFQMFVANRVGFIHSHTNTSQWRHISGASNVADIASRGAWPNELVHSKWFVGPDFLWDSQLPESVDTPVVSEDDPDVRSSISLASTSTSEFDVSRFSHVSSWSRLKKVVAICLAFMKVLRARVAKDRLSQLYPLESISADDILFAENEIVRLVQSHSFNEDISGLQNGDPIGPRKSSPLFKLHCFLDKDSLLRVGGRLRNSDLDQNIVHPVVLPKDSHVTQLVVAHCHEKIRHQGRGMTLNETRNQGFWIVGGSSVVSRYIYRCVPCRKLRSNTQLQLMADLPQDRVQPAPPFSYVGVDYFGPFIVKEKRKELKRWGVLFTCLSSRAVHLEVSDTLSTSSFLNALRRFISLRGPIKLLRSDQGTNFVGASNELKAAFSEIDNVEVRDFLLQNDCVFEFKLNPPGASHMGGAWERLIRSVRSILGVILSQHGTQLDDESLRTYFCEIAAIINGRPLTLAYINDPEFPEPLTPNHLLTCKSKVIVSPPATFQRKDVYAIKRWRRVQYLVDQFWSRWRNEYVHQLQSRSKWQDKRRNVHIGDIVVLKEENLPRNMWKMAKVVSVKESDDKCVRSVKLQMGDSNLDRLGRRVNKLCYLDRPVHKIVVLLELDE